MTNKEELDYLVALGNEKKDRLPQRNIKIIMT
jgi:hypothetical protein